jgi:polysaccharide biosynthesis transport protein
MTSEPQRGQLDVEAAVGAIRRRWKLVVSAAVAAALLAFVFSLLQDDRYKASADLLFGQPEQAPKINPTEPQVERPDAPERVAATNLALASLDRVAAEAKRQLNSPLSIEELRDRVELSPRGQADIVTITATGDTPREAARLANVFAREIVALRRERARERIQRVIDVIDAQLTTARPDAELTTQLEERAEQLRLERRLEQGEVEIAEAALPPKDRSAPKPLRNTLIGGMLGLILGLVGAVVVQRFDRRVESEEQIAEIVGAAVIARIPVERASGWERELFIESFQFLRANLQLGDSESDWRAIAVTSALPGDGKSTVAARLADALAFSGADVIVVDCDLRRPTLHEFFGTSGHEGFTTALVGLQDPVGLLRQTTTPGVRLLPAGPLLPLPASVFAGSTGMRYMMDRLRRSADYVIVATSPVTIAAEASAIVASVDAGLMVVDVDSARRDVLSLAADQLRSARANIVGVVLNRADVLLKDTAYRGYYGRGTPSPFAGGSRMPESEQEAAPSTAPTDGNGGQEQSELRRRRARSGSSRGSRR